ncbi:hypothetical protein [Romboutsia ilealis]|uniref:hypothetical protein n=1 Tax=Romboutsia ilealis TaxID=1115758 RepID=UPI00272BC963|nr:hypothetical protein [Romboutsia ilealis]
MNITFSSLYPSIIITFNIGPNCLVGKLIIKDKKIADRYNFKEIAEGKYDAGKDFMEAVLSENVLMTGVRWFNLPNTETLIEEFETKFKLNKKKKKSIVFRKEDVEKFFMDNMEINIY